MSKEQTFLNLHRVSELCGISLRQLSRIIEKREIRAFRIGRKRFVLAEDLARWIDRKPNRRLQEPNSKAVGAYDTGPTEPEGVTRAGR